MSVPLGKVTTFFYKEGGLGGTVTLGKSNINYWKRVACDWRVVMTPWC